MAPATALLHEKVVLITGAARGIGAAIAAACHGAGARVVAVGLDRGESTSPWRTRVTDVTAAAEVAGLVRDVVAEHGRIDV